MLLNCATIAKNALIKFAFLILAVFLRKLLQLVKLCKSYFGGYNNDLVAIFANVFFCILFCVVNQLTNNFFLVFFILPFYTLLYKYYNISLFIFIFRFFCFLILLQNLFLTIVKY